MALFDALEQQLAALETRGLRRVLRSVESPCGPALQVDGKPVLAFASNDYLGLAAHPKLVAALQAGAAAHGVGSGASHLISGHYDVHTRLEKRLAGMLAASIPHVRALYFGTGYMANLASITALAGSAASPDDCTIFSESLNHASLIDGARLARCKLQVYPHADVAALQTMLAGCDSSVKIVVTDGVFSMDGDLAPLPQLLALCEQYQAWLIVDDAHGFGVLGADGHGILQHFGLRSPNLVYMGTLGKAAGVSGAFVAADERVIEWLIQRARPYIYTTAAAPALAHALLASLDLLQSEEGAQRRAHLQALIAQWRHAMAEPSPSRQAANGGQIGNQQPPTAAAASALLAPGSAAPAGQKRWHCLPSATAIQPLIIGSNEEALRVAAALRARGLWVPAIRPPTVPAGTARLRVTLSAAHTHEQVQHLIGVLQELEAGSQDV